MKRRFCDHLVLVSQLTKKMSLRMSYDTEMTLLELKGKINRLLPIISMYKLYSEGSIDFTSSLIIDTVLVYVHL